MSLCQLALDKKLTVHFGEDKTKSIPFSKTKCLNKVNISFAGCSIQQHRTVEYLGCHFDSKLSDSAMASKVLREINYKLKFLYWQCCYQFLAFRKIFCNALIQSHFDYGCSSWFLLLKNKQKTSKNFEKQTSKRSKQIYSLLPKFTSEISHRSIAL